MKKELAGQNYFHFGMVGCRPAAAANCPAPATQRQAGITNIPVVILSCHP